MTHFDNSYKAVFSPGTATRYFDLTPLKAFDPTVDDFSPTNAWWLAECARIIYREDPDENGHPGPNRRDILRTVHLREIKFFNKGGIQAALLQSSDDVTSGFMIVTFRGTNELKDTLLNVQFLPQTWLGKGHVHGGFAKGFKQVWPDISRALEATLQRAVPPAGSHPPPPIFYTGHSLGAALATLAASIRPPHALYTYGSPRVGDDAFAETLAAVRAFRVVNHQDVITLLPPSLPRVCKLRHVGQLRYIAHDGVLRTAPSDDEVKKDRQKKDSIPMKEIRKKGWLANLSLPLPGCLSDHAPVNYVAHIERAL